MYCLIATEEFPGFVVVLNGVKAEDYLREIRA